MSDDKTDNTIGTVNTAKPDAPPSADHGDNALSGLMAGGDKGKRGPDLEQQALRAAEQALAEGERALAAARAQLHDDKSTPTPQRRRGRELALRALLIVNVLAMLVVGMLPSPTSTSTTAPTTPPTVEPHPPQPEAAKPPAPPRTDELWNVAIAAAARGEFAVAVTTLERYLAESKHMLPSQQMSVFLALSHYAANAGDIKKAQEYERKSRTLDQSHSLPEDLVAMARAAAESGDQESLRRVWARFLLQQRQIPSSLYPQVAAAYLQLGDSYRREADEAAEKARLAELAAIEQQLRKEAGNSAGAPK